MAQQEFLAIEFFPAYLKLAHAKSSGAHKREIVSLSLIPISGLADADIAKALATSYSAMKVKTLKVVDVIPASVAITKNIEVPSINPKEIREIINLQAGRHTPYSREEIIVDYLEVGVYKRNYTKILLVIVARSVIKKHTEIMAKAGLTLDRVMFAPEAIVHFASKAAKAESSNAPTCVVHIDENTADFTVAFKNKLLFVRSLPVGASQLLSDKEKSSLKLIEELKKSLEAYQNEDIDKGVGACVVIGAIAELGLESSLHQALQFPVKILSYTALANLQAQPLKTATERHAVSYLGLIAALSSYEESRADLVPEEIKLNKALQARARELVKTGMYVFSLLAILFLILISNIYFKSSYLAHIKEKYGAFGQEARGLEQDHAKIQMIKNFLASRGYPLEVLIELHALLPLEIELSDIRYDDQGKFSIKGTGESMSSVFGLVDDMEKSKIFKEVKTKYTTKRKEGKRDLVDFEITCLLEKEGKK